MGILAPAVARTCLETSIFLHQFREISILRVLYGSLWGFRHPHSRFFKKFIYGSLGIFQSWHWNAGMFFYLQSNGPSLSQHIETKSPLI